MSWEKLRFTKSEINKAGRIILKEASGEVTNEEYEKALNILNNFRAAHSYPLHVFMMRLRIVSKKVNPSSIVSRRLKRIPAIKYKLNRRYSDKSPTMKLYQMQDIGGCRAVVPTVGIAKELWKKYYLKSDLKHELINYKDYIEEPKEGGYRSYHIVFAYKSDKGKKEYNGLRIEVQIRSRLQHIWATAIEVVDFFTRQAIKTSEGLPEWSEFFKLVSSAIAIKEGCIPVLGTPSNRQELYNQIKKKERELNVIKKMQGWDAARVFFEEEMKRKTNARFFLLSLDIKGSALTISSYTEKEEKKAVTDYSKMEERYKDNKEFDVVLVGVDDINELKYAYPNYYVDTREFIEVLKEILSLANNSN